MGSGKFSRVWYLTTARSYANVLSPQDPEGFLKDPEALTQDPEGFLKDLQAFRGFLKDL